MTVVSRTHTPGRLAWFGALAPPLAWATQLIVGYALEEAACGRPSANLWGASIDPLTAIVIVVCGVVAILGGLASLTSFLSRGPDERGAIRFLAGAGLLGSLVFLLAIVLSGVALLALDGCSAA
jgi:hypothetical protein